MSHIINSESDLYKLNDLYKRLDLGKINEEFINEIMLFIIPKDVNGEKIIDYNFINESFKICFVPSLKCIDISLKYLEEWIKQNQIYLDLKYDCGCSLNKYLLFLVVLHEVEHSYQFLIGEEIVNAPCSLVKKAYKDLMDLMIDEKYISESYSSKVKRYYKYYNEQDKFFLERNANVEAMSDIVNLALINEDKKALAILSYLLNNYMCLGYENNTKGNIYYTYKKMHMLDEFLTYSQDDIKAADRIRYGLEISKDERKKIIEENKKLKKLARK